MHNISTVVKMLSVAAAATSIAACSVGTTSRSSSGDFAPSANTTEQLQATQVSSPAEGNTPIAVDQSNMYEVTSLTLKALIVTDSSVSVLNQSAEVTRDNVGVFNTASGVDINIAPLGCQNGGSIKIDGSVTGGNGNQPINFENSLLWNISTQFSNCVQSGNSINGDVYATFDMNLTELLDGSRFAFSADMIADDVLVAQEGQPSVLLNGIFTYGISSYDGAITNTSVWTESATYIDDNGLQTFQYDLEKSFDSSTNQYTYEVNSIFTADFMDYEYVEYATISPLRGAGSSYPSSGKILVLGLDNNVYITALENDMVLMELDENKDGSIDSRDYGNWEDLTVDVTQGIQVY